MITLGEKENENYMAVIEENKADWSERKKVFCYQETVRKQKEEFETFRDSMPSVSEAFAGDFKKRSNVYVQKLDV